MAKTSCINGHPMWNGDGKPVIWAYRIGYFVEYMKRHPDCILGDSGNGYQIFDCVREDPEEDLDVWYCDECGSVAVFTGHFRYDYCRMHSLPKIDEDIFDCWEEYVALRDLPYDEFMDFYDGKSPLEAIMTYHFPVKYWVCLPSLADYIKNQGNVIDANKCSVIQGQDLAIKSKEILLSIDDISLPSAFYMQDYSASIIKEKIDEYYTYGDFTSPITVKKTSVGYILSGSFEQFKAALELGISECLCKII